MAFANVNIGLTPSDNTGDPLRTAFNTINNNFANLAAVNGTANVVVYASGNANVTATYIPGVQSVAGRTGNVTLTVNDVIGAASVGYVNSLVASANITVSGTVAWANVTGKPTFATIATTGNWTDLAGKPTLAAIATTGSWLNLTNVPFNVSSAVTQTDINSATAPINANVSAANVKIIQLTNSITTLTGNAAAQAIAINLLNANIGSYEIWANAYLGGATYSNSNVSAYLINNRQPGTYSNSNVTAYLTTATINTTGNVTASYVRSNGNIAMTSNVARNVYVNSYAPASTQGNVGDIWYQTF